MLQNLKTLFFVTLLLPVSLCADSLQHGFNVTHAYTADNNVYQITELEHARSGAKIIHILAPDPENFFCIFFRTPHNKANGVAHVLEHTVLQGSKKYPDLNLFYALTKNSVASFINAATGSACTFYPAASVHETDFYNLLGIYCDAVFHPLLDPQVFQREGCYVACVDASCDTFTHKGIVYNEMKGANSSPYRRLTQTLASSLFPDTAYAVNYGGDIDALTTLSHTECVRFHEENYYPSNALFFFYGNIPLQKHLAFLDALQIFDVPKCEPKSIKKQPPLTEKVFQKHLYPATKDLDQTLMTLGWIQEIENAQEFISLEVLDAILFQTDMSLVKGPLIESGLCSNVFTIRDPAKCQALYELVVEIGSTQASERVQSLIFERLQELCEKGIDTQLVESACQRLLFYASELYASGEPKGHSLFSQCLQYKNLGFSVNDFFNKRRMLDAVQKKIQEDPYYFTALIKKHFLDNTQFACILLEPSSALLEKERKKEEQALNDYVKSLSDNEKKQIQIRTRMLCEEDLKKSDVVPKLTLEALSTEETKVCLIQEKVGALECFYHNAPTCGIIYADFIAELPQIPPEDVWQIQLYADLMTELGWGARSAKQTIQAIEKETANIFSYVEFIADAKDETCITGQLHLQAKTFDDKAFNLLKLFLDCSEHVDFEESRVQELVHRFAMQLKNQLGHLALSYAEYAALEGLCPLHHFLHETQGFGYYQKLQMLDSAFDNEICQKLAALHKKIFLHARHHLVLTCHENVYEMSKKHIEILFPERLTHTHEYLPLAKMKEGMSTAYLIPSAVAFNAQGVKVPGFCHAQSPYLALCSALCKNCLLTPRVRLQLGAYGAHASYEPDAGAFAFTSYRDPHIGKTWAIFKNAFELLTFDEQDLLEAKISLIQKLDKPQSPMERAKAAFRDLVSGKTDEMKESWRKAAILATKEDVTQAIEEHLRASFKKSAFISFAPGMLVDEEDIFAMKNIL
jgi:presequence protease